MTVTAIIHLRAKPGQGAALRDSFIAAIPHARADAACEGIDILVNAEDSDHVVLVEKWASVEEHGRYFEALQKTDEFAATAALIVANDSHHYEAVD